MSEDAEARPSRRTIEPYWYVILALVITGLVLFIYHQITGLTPDRVAFTIPFLNLDVFWYGIIITGGIAYGAYVTSRLASERGERLFVVTVPDDVRQRSLERLQLPAELLKTLQKRRITTLGQLLLPWGYNPGYVGLNKDGQREVRSRLQKQPGVAPEWLTDAPWRIWDPGHVWSGIIWCLIFAIIGARLYHVLTPSPSMAEIGINTPLDYFRNPLELINFRRGGLGIYGGLAGGLIGLFIYTRRARIPLLAWADIAAVGVALGQAIGRWANFFNQELYGGPSNLPWAVTIDPSYRLPEFADVSRFHPAFLYESLWSLLAFLLLLYLARRDDDRIMPGDLFALYLILYAVGRTLLELVRLDSRTVQLLGVDIGLPVATLVSIVVALLMAGWLIVRHRRQPQPASH